MLKALFAILALSASPTLAYTIIQGETQEFHTGLIHLEGEDIQPKVYKNYTEGCDKLPDAFDLRDVGTVPPVRNQGQCGSCWSFSKTASLESAFLAAGKPALDLAEQELVSCDKTQYGCGGGFLSGFEYQIDHGQGLEKDYPYTSGKSGRTGRCQGQPTVAAQAVDFSYIGAEGRYPKAEELKCALYKTHTIPWIVVSATGAWSNPPKDIHVPYTRCGRGQTNHAVGVVGWYTKDSKTYFIMRNSWGESWGDKGYMAMQLGCDSFGEETAFIEVK